MASPKTNCCNPVLVGLSNASDVILRVRRMKRDNNVINMTQTMGNVSATTGSGTTLGRATFRTETETNARSALVETPANPCIASLQCVIIEAATSARIGPPTFAATVSTIFIRTKLAQVSHVTLRNGLLHLTK